MTAWTIADAERAFDGPIPPALLAAIRTEKARFNRLPQAQQLEALIATQRASYAEDRDWLRGTVADRWRAKRQFRNARGCDYDERLNALMAADHDARRALAFFKSCRQLLRQFEAEYEAHVSGAYLPGYRGDRTEPPEPATFEAVLVEIKVEDAWQELPDWLLTESQLDALIGEMLIDYGECAEPAMAAE